MNPVFIPKKQIFQSLLVNYKFLVWKSGCLIPVSKRLRITVESIVTLGVYPSRRSGFVSNSLLQSWLALNSTIHPVVYIFSVTVYSNLISASTATFMLWRVAGEIPWWYDYFCIWPLDSTVSVQPALQRTKLEVQTHEFKTAGNIDFQHSES